MTTDIATEDFSIEFAEPEPIHGSNISDYLGVFNSPVNNYYEPPISLAGLSKMWKVNSHHGSCLKFRRNELVNAYQPNEVLSGIDYTKACTDFLHLGNAYFQRIYSRGGNLLMLKHVSALNVRPRPNGTYCYLETNGKVTDFQKGEILHIMEYETLQEIYGIPDWISCMQSALLNEDATLFRRRYYRNGTHLGYILVTNNEDLSPKARKAIKDAVAKGKGIGNFKTMYIHSPCKNKDSVQLLPVGDTSRKDEFERVKNVTAQDVMVAHRIPSGLAGIIPGGDNGNNGDPVKALKVYRMSELPAQIKTWTNLNIDLPAHAKLKFNIKFDIEDAA